MPKLTEDYSTAVIYQITYGDDSYIGSTAQYQQRMCNHRSSFRDPKSQHKLYPLLRDLGVTCMSECECKVIENYPILEGEPLEKKRKLELREAHWIQELKPSLNHNIPASTQQEQNKRAYQKAKAKPDYKEKKQAYVEANRDIIAEKKHVYYETVLREQRKANYICDKCDKILTLNNKSRHNKQCNPNQMIYEDRGRFRVRRCGKNAEEIGTFGSLEEAKSARRKWAEENK